MKYFFGFILFLIVGFGCKSKSIIVDGKYISEIKKNIIHFEDGSTGKLDFQEGSKTFYLIRHAEKKREPRKDPILTDIGYARSYRLADLMHNTKIDAAYSTVYKRTVHTIDSLMHMKGLEVKYYQPEEMNFLIEEITQSKSIHNVLISGHSNTTPALAGLLMGDKTHQKVFADNDYDNLLIINIHPDGTKNVYRLKYR